MMGGVVVVGSPEVFQKLRLLAPAALSVMHVQGTQGFSAQLRLISARPHFPRNGGRCHCERGRRVARS